MMAISFLAVAAALMTQPVALTPKHMLVSDVQAFPQIAAPATVAERRINQALDRLDAKVLVARRECFAGAMNPTSWKRRVDATMRGPQFLSFLVTDVADCGGAHPSETHFAIVYDLASGTPVDWARLLPPRLVGRQTLTEGGGGERVVTLSSRRLFAHYRAGYDRALDAAGPEECKGVADAMPADQPLLVWLDARTGGLAAQFDLNFAMQACSTRVIISAATLRHDGASPRLLRALAAAKAGAFAK